MNLKETVDRIGVLSTKLNVADDELSKLIVTIEVALRRCISVRLSIPIDSGSSLIFGKTNGKWSLGVEHNGRTTPLISCSREIRTHVFNNGLVEQLIVNAGTGLSDKIADRNEALAKAENLIAALTKAGV